MTSLSGFLAAERSVRYAKKTRSDQEIGTSCKRLRIAYWLRGA